MATTSEMKAELYFLVDSAKRWGELTRHLLEHSELVDQRFPPMEPSKAKEILEEYLSVVDKLIEKSNSFVAHCDCPYSTSDDTDATE